MELTISQLIKIILGVLVVAIVVFTVSVFFNNYIFEFFGPSEASATETGLDENGGEFSLDSNAEGTGESGEVEEVEETAFNPYDFIESFGGIILKDSSVSLDGTREETLQEVAILQEECDCEIVITSGTDYPEEGHKEGEYSHGTGYKVDLRSWASDGPTDYIKANFNYEGRRSDDAELYRNPETGALYALEEDHWDVLVK